VAGEEWPRGDLNSIDKYYTDKGFTPNPPLELKEKNQVASYEKPLPEGRVHVKVFRTPKYYVLDQHTDSADPNRNPLGHLADFVSPGKHTKKRVKRRDVSN
jgi:hypothetical protein